jgi:serine/threonine-protein phosphatase 2A regulatory subunit B
MEHMPVLTMNVQEYLRPKLRELYLQDYIFDKFKCSVSHDDRFFVTGTYGDRLCIFDPSGTLQTVLHRDAAISPTAYSSSVASDVSASMWGQKALQCDWHPARNTVVVGGIEEVLAYSTL